MAEQPIIGTDYVKDALLNKTNDNVSELYDNTEANSVEIVNARVGEATLVDKITVMDTNTSNVTVEVENARVGESTLLAKITDMDAKISSATSGSGVLISGNDTNIGFLEDKFIAGDGITLVKNNPGGNETLTATSSLFEDPAPKLGNDLDLNGFEIIGLNVDPQLAFVNKSNWADDAEIHIPFSESIDSIAKAHVSVYEEVPQTGSTSNMWDLKTNESGFTTIDSAYAVSITPASTVGQEVDFTLGSGSWAATDVGKCIANTSTSETGVAYITSVLAGVATCFITESFTDTSAIASGDWELKAGVFVDGNFQVSSVLTGVFDVSLSVYASESLSISALNPAGFVFGESGSTMYIVSQTSDSIYQFNLPTPYNLSTASQVAVKSVSAQDSAPVALAVNSTGTKLLMLGQTSKKIYEYDLETAHDLDTLVYTSNSFDVSTEESTPRAMTVNDSGSHLYIAGQTSDTIYQYEFTESYDLLNLSYVSKSFYVGGQSTTTTGLSIDPSGVYIHVLNYDNKTIYRYSMADPLDIDTSSYDSKSFSVSLQEAFPTGLAFSDEGTRMFVSGINSDKVHAYDITTTVVSVSSQHIATVSASDSINTTYYTDLNSISVTEDLDGETANYAFSMNPTFTGETVTGGSFYVIGTGETTTRKIISSLNSDHGGTEGDWYYNSNATYASETWTAATNNNTVQALEEAQAVAANSMSSSDVESVGDDDWPTFGTMFALAIILYTSSSLKVPKVDKVEIDYDANILNQLMYDYIVDMPSTDTVRVTAPSSGGPRNARVYISK